EDLGRVIGKRGVTAQSLRTLLRALGTKNDARYNLKIVNNDEGYERPVREEKPAQEQAEEPSEVVEDSNESSQEEEAVKNSTDEPVDNASDYSKKTRQELAELDDLDI